MAQILITGLICEDIRAEKSGQETLVGIFPDNIRVPEFPGAIPKLSIYVRIHIDPAFDPGPIKIRLIVPSGEEHDLSELSEEFIKHVRDQALAKGAPIAGIISRATISPLQIGSPGRLIVVANVQGKEFPCAALNFEKTESEDVTSSSAPTQPS